MASEADGIALAGEGANVTHVHVHVRFESADFQHSLFVGLRRIRFLGALLGVVVVLGVILTWPHNTDPITVVVALASLVCPVLMVVVLFLLILVAYGRGMYKGLKPHQRVAAYVFGSTHVRASNEKSWSETAWEDFAGSYETKRAFFLVGSGNQLYPIPKRSFANPDDMNRLKALLAEKIQPTKQRLHAKFLVIILLWLTLIAAFFLIYRFLAETPAEKAPGPTERALVRELGKKRSVTDCNLS